VVVNCAALLEHLLESELFGHMKGAFTGADRHRAGAFVSAAGGTLFLDEIGEMNVIAQSKLFRVLEKRCVRPLGSDREVPVDVRFVAATNRDPERLVREQHFPEDLLFRLNVSHLHLPPLRSRRDDIPLLIDHLMPQCATRQGTGITRLDTRTMERLFRYDWPGNARELRNFIEAVLATSPGPVTHFKQLPLDWRDRLRMVTNRGSSERSRVLEALTSANWNKSEAARALCCSRMTV
jgi:DNA-binding NtrC family response regulator